MSRIMAHLVAHYPDRERSLAVARGLARGGAAYLEVQFAFSDPTADGPVIQQACQTALESGFRVDAGFDFVREIAAGPGGAAGRPSVFIMTYASLVYARGVRRFLSDGVAAGADGFILPDIPLDYDEGVWEIAGELGTRIVPVSVTSAREERVNLLLARQPEYVYVALRRGITGARTEIGEENLRFLDRLRDRGVKVLAGFGISGRDQVVALEPHVHASVVGSAFVRTVAEHAVGPVGEIESAIAKQARELAGLG